MTLAIGHLANAGLRVSSVGLRLIAQFEGKPRLMARECEGGRWELGYGCTFWPDGRAVQEGETCTYEQAVGPLFLNALRVFEAAVKRHVTVKLAWYQFDALVALSYNIGEANFSGSTVLSETNASRWDDAAAAFGMWVFATKNGHKQALRGLLRRHYAEGCLYLGYDWTEATEDDAIALKREKPPGDPPTGRDKVVYKTPWKSVRDEAQKYPIRLPDEYVREAGGSEEAIAPAVLSIPPLSDPELIELAMVLLDMPDPVADLPEFVAEEDPLPDLARVPAPEAGPVLEPHGPNPTAQAPSVPAAAPQPAPAPPPVAKPAPAPAPAPAPPAVLPPPPKPGPTPKEQHSAAGASQTSGVDWSGLKPMFLSRRFWGLALIVYGRLHILWFGSSAMVEGATDPIVQEMFSGFAVMAVGELINWWGSKKATRGLK